MNTHEVLIAVRSDVRVWRTLAGLEILEAVLLSDITFEQKHSYLVRNKWPSPLDCRTIVGVVRCGGHKMYQIIYQCLVY